MAPDSWRKRLVRNETHTSSVSIVEQIKLVAKLQTVEYHGTTTVRKNKEHAFGKSSVLYLAEGKVLASVDLEQMQIQVLDAGAGAQGPAQASGGA